MILDGLPDQQVLGPSWARQAAPNGETARLQTMRNTHGANTCNSNRNRHNNSNNNNNNKIVTIMK